MAELESPMAAENRRSVRNRARPAITEHFMGLDIGRRRRVVEPPSSYLHAPDCYLSGIISALARCSQHLIVKPNPERRSRHHAEYFIAARTAARHPRAFDL